MLCAKFGSVEEGFLNFNIEFSLFRNYLTLENAMVLYLNWNPHHLRMFCAKFSWNCNWPSSSREEDFLILSMYFSLFRNYLHLDNGEVLHLNKRITTTFFETFGWNWPSASREEDENVESLLTDERMDRQIPDDRRSEKLT